MVKLSEVNFDDFAKSLAGESDRACGVLGAALLDAKLEVVFESRIDCFQEELLNPGRPIGAFSTRIKLARALGWIDDVVRSDLEVVRDIRNAFAHSFDHTYSFGTQSVVDLCGNLKAARGFIEGFDSAAATSSRFSVEVIRGSQEKFASPRWRFQIEVELLSYYLDRVAAKNPETDIIAEAHQVSARWF